MKNQKCTNGCMRVSEANLHISVCLSSPCFAYPIIALISFSKPLSNIRSASSRTRYSTPPKSHAPSFTRSRILPGVPTITRVVSPSSRTFFRALTCPDLSTPPKTATLAMPKGAPSAERVSCVWMASSRVGATTRTETVDPCDALCFLEGLCLVGADDDEGDEMRRARAGRPNASVLPLKYCISDYILCAYVHVCV